MPAGPRNDRTGGDRAGEEQAALRDVVERVGLVLAENGLPRMTARVFAYVLVDDADRYTAGELAAGLQVSQAAVSNAVRQLVHAGFLDKVREPGQRSDQYRIDDEDVWSAITRQRIPSLQRWEKVLGEVVDQVPDGPGRRRVQETLAYLSFLQAELPELVERWQRYRRWFHEGLDTGGSA
ncbi:hypothetical protein GCM10027174_23870 [Salinifilum aidingensis]